MGGHMGPHLQGTPGVHHRTKGGGKPPPYRVASSDARRTTGEQPGEARPKRVARTALRSMPHSGNGRENGPVSEATPRRYICTRLPNQAPP